MTTQEFISFCLEEFGAALTRQRCMEMANRVQNEILGEKCDLMRVKPDPFFATTDATYSYVASTSIYDSSDGTQGSLVGDIRSVDEIYSFDNSVSIFDYQTLDPASYKPNFVQTMPTVDRVSARYDQVQSRIPNSSDCTIKLWEGNNPGTTTVVWRARCYKWPTQVLSESIQLTLPYDFHDTLLYWGIAKRVRKREFGRDDVADAQYDHYLKKFRSKYGNTPAQDQKICLPRDF